MTLRQLSVISLGLTSLGMTLETTTSLKSSVSLTLTSSKT